MNERKASHQDEIERSWARAAAAGLRPDQSLSSLEIEDVDDGSRLIDAANPVLTRMAEDLDGTGYSVILADRDARLVDLRFGDRRLEDLMADDGAIRGRRFTEHSSGTNSLATVHEIRAPLRVFGDEHYIEGMRKFACYGMPVIHPTTNRLEGVVDISCLTHEDNALLGPMIRRAVGEIQDRLLERSHERERRLFIAFQDAVRRFQYDPVVAVGEGITLTNRLGADLVEPVDQAVLRAAAVGSARGVRLPSSVALSSGVDVDLAWLEVEPRLYVVRMLPRAPGAHNEVDRPARAHSRRPSRPPRLSFLVRGESGTGRTTALRAADPDVRIIDSARLFDQSPTEWLKTLSDAAGRQDHLVGIEHIELLPPLVARRVREMLTDAAPWFAFTETSSPTSAHTELRHLARLADETKELIPLRSTPHRIPEYAETMLQELAPTKHLTSSAAAMLAGRQWRGNLSELREVLARASARSAGNALLPSDFGLAPESEQASPLAALARSERDAILAALAKSQANKTTAARELGVSRTTLYKKMRDLGIPG